MAVSLACLSPALAWAQTNGPARPAPGSEAPGCMYTSVERSLHILKRGESFKETWHAYDVTGEVRTVAVTVMCGKDGPAMTMTLDGAPVAVWDLPRRGSTVLRIGESVSDLFWVYTPKKPIQLPLTVRCVDHNGPDLELTATLDGQSVEFYSDRDGGLYALKHGELAAGTARIKFAKGWYLNKSWWRVTEDTR